MKYLIFNITVAATLVYLVAGDELDLSTPQDIPQNIALISEGADTVKSLTLDDVRPMVEEMLQSVESPKNISPEDVKAIVSASIAEAIAQQKVVSIDIPEEAALTEMPLETIYVETPVTHAVPVEIGGLSEPERADPLDMQVAEAFVAPIQLAEGEDMMAPKTRQKELDKLVNSLEMLFLDKTN